MEAPPALASERKPPMIHLHRSIVGPSSSNSSPNCLLSLPL